MEKKGFYHLFSDGFRTSALFEDTQAFISGMNIVGICSLKCDITILTFILMDNHVHFILYGSFSACTSFKEKFLHRYALWYSNRYSGKKYETIEFDMKIMEDEKYILNSITYVLKNSVSAGYAFCIEDYPWSSGGLYFRMSERMNAITSGWKSVSEMTVRERRNTLQTQTEVPGSWKVTPEGYLWPGNYIGYRMVEKLFRSPRSFTFFMGHGKEEEVGVHKNIALPDTEVREKAIGICRRLYDKTNLRSLSVEERLTIGRKLRKEYGCSLKQIARIVHIEQVYLKDNI